jgi:hypothetical protein
MPPRPRDPRRQRRAIAPAILLDRLFDASSADFLATIPPQLGRDDDVAKDDLVELDATPPARLQWGRAGVGA